jgi:hypothetical protein
MVSGSATGPRFPDDRGHPAGPEPKTVKNRLHLCLRPDVLREVEVERLLGIGAALVADRRNLDGTGWAVLADPEGNEFCVLRSEVEL